MLSLSSFWLPSTSLAFAAPLPNSESINHPLFAQYPHPQRTPPTQEIWSRYLSSREVDMQHASPFSFFKVRIGFVPVAVRYRWSALHSYNKRSRPRRLWAQKNFTVLSGAPDPCAFPSVWFHT